VKRSSMTAVAVACIATVVLSGCGNGSDSDGSAARATTSSPSTTPSSVEPSSADATEETDASEESTSPAATGMVDLKTYVAAGQKIVDQSMGTFNGVYSKISVEAVPPNGLEYVYDFAKAVDVPAAREQIEGSEATLKTAFETQIAPEMKAQVGIEDPEVTYTYRNPDGTVIWTHTFTSG
jgi:hypothetical protein